MLPTLFPRPSNDSRRVSPATPSPTQGNSKLPLTPQGAQSGPRVRLSDAQGRWSPRGRPLHLMRWHVTCLPPGLPRRPLSTPCPTAGHASADIPAPLGPSLVCPQWPFPCYLQSAQTPTPPGHCKLGVCNAGSSCPQQLFPELGPAIKALNRPKYIFSPNSYLTIISYRILIILTV